MPTNEFFSLIIFIFLSTGSLLADKPDSVQSETTSKETNDSLVTIGFDEEWVELRGKRYISEVNYDKKDGKVYAMIAIEYIYSPNGGFPSIVKKRLNADVTSFSIVSENKGVAVDRNKVFIQGMEKNEQENSLAYENDSDNVASIIPNIARTDYDLFDADPATLINVRDEYNLTYFKDKDHVYYMFDRIPGADAGTFEYIDRGYAKDKKYAYHKNKPIEKSDVETFKFLKFALAKDTNHVYFNGNVLNMYDTQTFMIVAVFQNYYVRDNFKQHYYLKDKHGVYINHEIIPYADPGSFEMVFALNRLDTLNMYAKDKNHVFTGTKILQGADPVTFRMDYDEDKKEFVYFDKNYFYKNGERSEKTSFNQENNIKRR